MEVKPSLTMPKGKKNALWIVVLASLGILFVVFGGTVKETNGEADSRKEQDAYYSVRFYTEDLEERIAELCRQIKGVSVAHVLLTLDGGTENVFAENRAGASCDYVIVEGANGEEPILIREIYPQIRGVAVVCTKGNDSDIQRTVTELLSAALGISSSRIRVAGT